jgi:cytochrome P450
MMRTVIEPFTVDGFEFEKGDAVRVGIGLVLTNLKYFDDPMEFKPDRFNRPFEHQNAFIPFSGGPRNCIGQHMAMMEVRIALVEILKRYKLVRTEVPFQMKLATVIAKPINHLLVKFLQRTDAIK